MLTVRYLVFPCPPAGATTGVAEWSCRTCMRSSREWSQLASVIVRLLCRPETFSLHDVVDFPLSAWHLGSKGTHRSASGGKICETRSVGMGPGQKCSVFVFLYSSIHSYIHLPLYQVHSITLGLADVIIFFLESVIVQRCPVAASLARRHKA